MTETEKYQGYAWIKVKKHVFDPQKSDKQNYDDLQEHHVTETTFLIEKVRELAQRLDAAVSGPEDSSPEHSKIVDLYTYVHYTDRMRSLAIRSKLNRKNTPLMVHLFTIAVTC